MTIAFPDASGAFRLDRLNAGSGEVDCFGDDAYASERIVVPPDDVVNVKLVWQGAGSDHTPDVGLKIETQFDDQIVVAVQPGSPAEKAGLQVGDVIVEVDGIEASMLHENIMMFFDYAPPGKVIKLTFDRGDKRQATQLTVGP
jgi:S1-C subfamily serine protease